MFKNGKLHGLVLRLAAVLLILVMLSTSMVAGRYARYSTTVSASDSARVAKFSVVETGAFYKDNIAIAAIPGETCDNILTVQNDSEVAVNYKITVTTPAEKLPLSFKIRLQNDNVLYDIPYEGRMEPGTEYVYVLEANWAGSADAKYSGMIDLVQISVSATQID